MAENQRPAVIVGSLAEARLAAGFADRLLIVATPAFGWAAVQALADLAGVEIAYDPAERAGFAADALQRGAKAVLFPVEHPQRAALAALAEAAGGRLLPPPEAPLMLALERDAADSLQRLLASQPPAG